MNETNTRGAILITGANRGLGLGYVKHYLIQGFFVLATIRNPDETEELLKLQKGFQEALIVLKLDVGSEISIAEFVKELNHRKLKLSLVINNAGVSIEENFGHWTMANFENQFRINTIGPALVSQAILPFLENNSKLIQISSGLGSLKWNINPEMGFDAYAASKCALHSITIRLGEKLRTNGVGVYAISPGWVKTDMGGKEAPTTIDEAISDITATIGKLKLEQSGSFLSEKGEIIPW